MSTSSDPFDGLPVEILRDIVAPLTRKELKALRLTSRKLRDVASEKMFETIRISTTDASFVRLMNIAASDFWRKQVRHVHWVLLNESGYHAELLQIIQFKDISTFGPWVKNLQGHLQPKIREPVYHGLDLQCQILRRMGNVQTIRFWCAVAHEREKREPWQPRAVTSELVVENSMDTHTIPYPSPTADAIFPILIHSNVKPNRVETVASTVYLAYSRKGHLNDVEIIPLRDDRRRCDPPEADNPFSHRPFRTDVDKEEMDYFSHDMNCFRSLGDSNISTLRALKISGIWIFVDDLETVLTKNPQLELLRVSKIELSDNEDGMQPMADVLLFLRRFYEAGTLAKLSAEFDNVGHRDLSGAFSASQEQVRAWMKGDSDDLLDLARSAFKEIFDSDELSDDSDNSEDNGDNGDNEGNEDNDDSDSIDLMLSSSSSSEDEE